MNSVGKNLLVVAKRRFFMCVRDVIHQIKQIFLSPKSMWTEISSQTVTTESVYIRWIVGFALLSTFSRSASVFMGMYVETKKLNLSFNLLAFSTMTAINFVLNILFVFAVSLAISEMAPVLWWKKEFIFRDQDGRLRHNATLVVQYPRGCHSHRHRSGSQPLGF